MCKQTWLISDTHFGHGNILNFTNKDGNRIRPEFNTVEEMDEYMVTAWNEVVKDVDTVYHLGDVFVGDKEKFKKLWSTLKGKKRLIVGNHDDIKWMAKNDIFSKIMLWKNFREHKAILTHIPLHDYALFRDGQDVLNIHGHVHGNPSPSPKHKCVCVEHIKYKPINIEEALILNTFKTEE